MKSIYVVYNVYEANGCCVFRMTIDSILTHTHTTEFKAEEKIGKITIENFRRNQVEPRKKNTHEFDVWAHDVNKLKNYVRQTIIIGMMIIINSHWPWTFSMYI